jgi:hypothetical protein
MILRHIVSLLLLIAASLPGLLAAEEEYWEYTFRPGDSIWKIAEQYTTSVDNWVEIQALNKIRQGPDRRIPPGTRIIIPVSMLKQQPVPAVVIAVSGAASVVRVNGDSEIIVSGTKLYSGDRVITGDEQNLRMQFADRSELQVLPNSRVVLDKLSHHQSTGMVDTQIRLNSGSVNTWVEELKPDSRYEIKTPAAVTAVRGTAYRLSSTSQLTRTEVTEGNVGVSAGEAEKIVRHGFGIVAEKDKPLPEPVKLLSAPELGENLSSDKTLLKLSWKPLEGAETYRYQLAMDDGFNEVVVDSTTENSTLEIKDLTPGRYYLLVRGVDRYRLQGLDAVAEYEIQQAPPPVEEDYTWTVPLSVGVFILLL